MKDYLLPLVLSFIGAVFLIIGLVVGTLIARSARAELTRIAAMEPYTAAALIDVQPGKTVMVEGQISAANPLVWQSFVAYTYYEWQEDDDDSGWVERSRTTPSLLIDLPGGQVMVSNDDYRLNSKTAVEPSDEKRYEGLEIGEPVLVVGEFRFFDGYPRLDAEFVAAGSQADYLAAQRTAVQVGRILGLVFGSFGAIFLSVGVVLGSSRLRK